MVPIKRTCDVENIGDFARYYQSSWVGWHGTDSADIQPCFVGRMDGADTVTLRPLVKGEDSHFSLKNTFPVYWTSLKEHVDFGVPDIGMIPDGPTILFASYSTPRVAKKGFRSRDTRIADFNSYDIKKKYSAPGSERYDWIWFAFNPEYKSLEQAEEKLTKGEVVGVPLSRTLGVYSTPKFKNSLLAYKRWTVGQVLTPYLISLKKAYAEYEEDIAKQTGAEVIVE
jgi:hypothetical protein